MIEYRIKEEGVKFNMNLKYTTSKVGLVFLGDIHGNWNCIKEFCEKFTDYCIIQVGDFGIGFKHQIKEFHKLKKLSEVLEKTNNELFVIRGNHDDPSYFNGKKKIDLPNIKFLLDYSVIKFQDTTIQIVGGGISIDRHIRNVGKSWWQDETIQFCPDKIEKVDVLITHVAPTMFPICKAETNPMVKQFHELEYRYDTTKNLLQELNDEKEQIQKLSDLSECKTHYFGHYHITWTGIENGRKYCCLNIKEFKEFLRVDV